MRSRSARHGVRVLVGSVGLALFWISAGCGRPGYMLKAEAMCARLNAVNVKENVGLWVGKEIEGHMVAATNRPTSLTLTNMPHWVERVDPGNCAYTIHYEVDPDNGFHLTLDHYSTWRRVAQGCMLGTAGRITDSTMDMTSCRPRSAHNQHMQPDPAISPLFHVERQLRGAADMQRWTVAA